jgi:hypothetical protein
VGIDRGDRARANVLDQDEAGGVLQPQLARSAGRRRRREAEAIRAHPATLTDRAAPRSCDPKGVFMTASWKMICGALLASALSFACTDSIDGAAQAAVSGSADASGSGSEHRPPPPKPPQEAIDACASLAEGADCAFDLDGHHVTGTCSQGPDGDGPLACKPDQPPPPPKPPQEAIDACASLAEGADCAFSCNGDPISGTCLAPPDGSGPLACAPDQPPPPR